MHLWSLLALLGVAAPRPSAAYDAPGAAAPERAYDIEAVDLQVELDVDAREVRGTVRYTARPLHVGPLVLDQIDIDIHAVDGVDAPAPPHYVHDGHLVVEAGPEHLGPDGKLDITIRFSAHPWTGVHFRGASPADRYPEVWTQGQRADHRHWFPSWDHPNDRFAYTGSIQAPAGWQAFTNSGHVLPTYLIMFAAGPYDVHPHTADPTTEVWVPPGTHPEAVARVLDPIPAMKAHFAERTGMDYPWGDYLQVFVQRFLYFGMENTGATINAARALVDDRVAETRPRVETLIAHELAHQWFGDLLTCRTWRDLWLNEGFASFMTGDYVAERQATPAERDAVWAAFVYRWFERSRAQPQPLAQRWHNAATSDAYNVYNRGAATLWMLRADLGEDAFWASIQDYVAQHAHGSVETVDLRRAFEARTGRDLTGFFQQWTESTGSPTLQVSERRDGDSLVVTIQQDHGEAPRHHIPVEVQVSSDAGVSSHRTWMHEDTVQLTIPVKGDIRWVAANPRGAVLGTWTHTQTDDRLEAQATEADAFARLTAIHALGDTDATEALGRLVADATAPRPYREAAAASLGRQGAHGPLLAAHTTDDDAVRLAIAQALGHCPHAAVPAVLDALAQRDANPDVRGAALTALARVQPKTAVVRARRLTRLPDQEQTWLVGAALDVLGTHGSASDISRMVDPALPFRNRSRGLRAAAAWVERQPDPVVRAKHAPTVARAAEKLLSDLDLRTRQAALEVLAKVGDTQSIDLLEAHRRTTSVAAERTAAKWAVLTIRGRSSPEFVDPTVTQQAELQALSDRLDALEAQVKAWEDHH